MVVAQHNGSTAADAAAGFPQRFTLLRPVSPRQQRGIASRGTGHGAAGLSADSWRGLRVKLTQDSEMADAAQSAESALEVGSTSASSSRQRPQRVQRAVREMAAGDAAAEARRVDVSRGLRGQQQAVTAPQLSALRLTAALAQYPQGSRVLHAANRDFLLVPLSNIRNESYTAYFDMVSRRFPYAAEESTSASAAMV